MIGNSPNIVKVNPSGAKVTRIVVTILIVIAALIVIGSSFTIVSAGHTGVVTTFGKVSDTVLAEGLHFKIPFVQEIILVDNRVQKAEVACSSASKDLQTVSSTIAINYKVLNSNSAQIYKNVGMDYESIIISPAIQECVKAVTAKFTAEELITNRQSVGDQMSTLLKDKIASYGLEIQIFNIISFDFTAEYNAAIEAKQTAQQNALKAEQDLQRIKVEAEQTIAQAEAEAAAYKLKSEQLTPQMILMEYIDKWDGKLPTVASGESGSMMLDISSMLDEMQNGTNTYIPSSSSNTASAENTAEIENTDTNE